MATLFRKKHRSVGKDALEENSIPYASTSTPAAPPVPRQSISSDGPALNDQRSRASDVSMASGLASPTLRDTTPSMNLIPEHLPYENGVYNTGQSSMSRSSQHSSTSRKRSETPDLGSSQQRRRPSTTAESDLGHRTSSIRPSGSAARPPSRTTDSLTYTSSDARYRQSSATSNSGFPGSDGFARANSRSSNHGRHSEASEGRRGSSNHHTRDRTASTQSRSDQLIPPYSPTMRSIGSSSSQFAPYPYNTPAAAPSTSTSQASQQAAMRASQASTHSVKSHRSSISLNSSRMAPPTPPITSSEFVFPRPSSDEDIEGLFEGLLQRTDVPVRDRDGMRQWPLTKKWTMVYNDKLQDWKQGRKPAHSERGTPQMQSTPTMGGTAAVEPNAPLSNSQHDPNNKMRLQRGKTESPEWYLTKFMDGSIQPAIVSSLTVGLRTYEISWVETFVNKLHGLSVLTNALANISKLPVPRKEHDLKLELEIVKCLKHLLQMQVGPPAMLEKVRTSC